MIEEGIIDEGAQTVVYGYSGSPAEAYAVENSLDFVSIGIAPYSVCGMIGADVAWYLGTDGTLEIRGSGEMYEYDSSADLPWREYSGEIKKVKIFSGVTTISGGAFFYYTALESVEIADTVTEIRDHAFAGTAISSLEIPESVTFIGYLAFGYCENLASVTILYNVTAIEEKAFSSCAEGFTIYGYKGTAAEEYAATDEAITFVALERAEDVDGDGIVSVSDVLTVLSSVLNGETSVDINGDGEINLIDIIRILKLMVK